MVASLLIFYEPSRSEIVPLDRGRAQSGSSDQPPGTPRPADRFVSSRGPLRTEEVEMLDLEKQRHRTDIAALIRDAAEPLPAFDDPAFGRMFDRFARTRVVL